MTPVEAQILQNQLAIMAALSELMPSTDRAVDCVGWIKTCVQETTAFFQSQTNDATWPPPCAAS
jgi:hypothetical protein